MTDPSNVSPGRDKQTRRSEQRLKEQESASDFEDILEEDELAYGNAEIAYKLGLDYLENVGYKLVPSPQGIAANHDVYKLSEPPRIKGLDLPDNYFVWKPIYRGPAYNLFLSVIQAYISEDPEPRKIWAPLLSPVGNKMSTLYALAVNSLQAKSQEQLQSAGRPLELGIEPQPRVLTTNQDANECAPRAFVPAKDWFSPRLQKVTLDDLFTIFPPAERKLFSLIVGRAMTGRNNSLTASGNLVKHTARMAAVVCGPAGLGKSTLFEALWSAAVWGGYQKKTVKNFDARFNMGRVAVADIIYKDDTSQKEIRKLFESATVKTIITSNDVLAVEDKGQDAYEVIPIGTLFMNANEFNPRDTFSMDPGMADRIKILSTISKSEADNLKGRNRPEHLELGELALESPDALPWHHLDWLCEKLDVSKLALMLWALRLCIDEFISTIETTIDDKGQPINQLAEDVREITLQLRTHLFKDITEQILTAAKSCSQIIHRTQVETASKPEDWITFQKNGALIQSFFDVRTGAHGPFQYWFYKWHFENIDSSWQYHPYLGLRNANRFFTIKAYQEACDVVALDGRGEFDKVLHFFKAIRASNGVEVSADPVWLFQAAENCKDQFNRLENIRRIYNWLVYRGVPKDNFEDFLRQRIPYIGKQEEEDFGPDIIEKLEAFAAN
jgi:hypothetical protein